MSDYGSDYEHTWNVWPFHGQNIMTCVRDQGGRPTCIFHALCAAYEIDFRRLLALEEESVSTDFQFYVEAFIREFEETYGALGTDPPGMRLQNAIQLFQERGVLASANVWEEDMRVQLVGTEEHPNITFAAVEDILEQGKPVIGGLFICQDDRFRTLGRNEVYTSDPDLDAAWGTYGHLVVFIGSGARAKRPYLVFLNSEGEQIGKDGYGRVWFSHVRAFRTLDLESVQQQQPPPPPPPPSPTRKRSLAASNSSSSSTVGSMIWKSDPRKKRYRSNRSNPGGSDVLTDRNEVLSVSLECETKEMAPVKTDRIVKDDEGSDSSSDDDITEDKSSSEQNKSNDEMDGSGDEDEEIPKKPEVCVRVAETALKAKSLVPDKKAKIAAPSVQKTGEKGVHVQTHPTKQVNKAPAKIHSK